MKILFVNKLYPPDVAGGAEVTIATLAAGVQAAGVDVRVVTTTAAVRRIEDTVDGVPVVRLPLWNVYWHNDTRRRPQPLPMLWHAMDVHNPAMGRALRAEIESYAPDLVSFHNLPGFSAAAWDAATEAGVPAIQVLHDYYHLCARSQLFRNEHNCERRCMSCRLLRFGRGRSSRQLRGVVGISRSVLDAHVQAGLFQDVQLQTVIHNARTLPTAAMRRYPKRALTFGSIGTLAQWKGSQLLLESFERVSREPHLSKVRLLVAGTGDDQYTAELRERFDTPAISFLGQVTAKTFFPKIDVLIVPSLWREPLGMVAVEALIAGVPVIGSARGGLPEIVSDGVNGLLFDPDRAGDLERCIHALAAQDGLLGKLGERTIASVESFGNLKRMIDEYLDVYRQLARRPAS